jgi:(p)ppGpp synthase/HD superfamily hydrolase
MSRERDRLRHGALSGRAGSRASSLVQDAVDSAERWHGDQRRASDGAPFLAHPIEVAQLLVDAGAPETVVAAGILHDVIEKTDATIGDLVDRFGPDVARLVAAVSDLDDGLAYRVRKRELRRQVEHAGQDAWLILAADTVSKVRDFARLAEQDPQRFARQRHDQELLAKIEHYHRSAQMLQRRARWHPLVQLLQTELAGLAG